MLAHIRKAHENEKYPCSQCEYQGNQENLITHIQYKHESSNNAFACDPCDLKIGSKRNWKVHMKSIHQGAPPM